MSEYETLLQELEQLHASNLRSARTMRKSLSAGRPRGNTRRRPDFGKPAPDRAPAAAGIDLVKAEQTLRNIDRAGLLTKAQSDEAWRRLMNLRPVQVVPIK